MIFLSKSSRVLVVFAVLTVAFSETTEKDFSVHLELLKDVVKVGTSVKGRLIETNTSNHDIELNADRSNRAEVSGYKFEVLDAKGNTPGLTEWGRALMGGGGPLVTSPGYKTLKPGESLELIFDLNEIYHLTSPGVYSVEAQGVGMNVKSDKSTFTLTE